MLVFIHHHKPFFGLKGISLLKDQGWIGVDIFFVLSTFLLTRILIQEYDRIKSINFRNFYLRRIFRIWPIYFLFIGFAVGLGFYFDVALPEGIMNRTLGLLLFFDNINSALNGPNTIQFTSHLWTISFEEQYYLLLPMVVLLLIRTSRQRRIYVLITALVLFNVIRVVLIVKGVSYHAIYVLPFTHFESSVMGIVMGFGGLNFLLEKVKSHVILLISIISFLVIDSIPRVEQLASFWQIGTYGLAGISSSFFLWAVMHNKTLKQVFALKILTDLGKRSYGLYVYHLFANFFVAYIISNFSALPNDPVTTFFLALIISMIFSIMSYAWIERPFLKIKNQFRY